MIFTDTRSGLSLVDALLDPAGGLFGQFENRIAPMVTIRDEDGVWALRTDLPGVRPEDLQLEVEGRVLRIAATREGREIAFAVRLPSEIDASGASSHLEHGVLELRLPRALSARAVRIPVVGSLGAGTSTEQITSGE